MNLIPMDGAPTGSEQQPPAALLLGAETFPHIPLGFCWLCLVEVATILPLYAPQPPPLQADQTQQLPSPLMLQPQPQGNLLVLLDLLQFVHECDTGSPRGRRSPTVALKLPSRWKQSISLLDFLLTEHSTLQCHKTWSFVTPLMPGEGLGAQRGSQACESGMGWHWMYELETTLEEPARLRVTFPGPVSRKSFSWILTRCPDS